MCAKRAVALKALARSKLGIPVGKAQLGKPEKVERKRALLADAKSILPSSMVHDPACRGVGGHLLRLLPFTPPVLRRDSGEANGGDDEEGDGDDAGPPSLEVLGKMRIVDLQLELKARGVTFARAARRPELATLLFSKWSTVASVRNDGRRERRKQSTEPPSG